MIQYLQKRYYRWRLRTMRAKLAAMRKRMEEARGVDDSLYFNLVYRTTLFDQKIKDVQFNHDWYCTDRFSLRMVDNWRRNERRILHGRRR